LVVPPYCSEAVRTLATNRLEVVVCVAVHLDGIVSDDAEVARTAPKNGVEEIGVRAGIDGLDLGIVVYKPDLPNMVTEQPKATAKLAVASCLRMPADMHISTLSVWEEQVVLFQEAIELTKTEADTDVDERFVSGLIKNLNVVVEILECWLHVEQDTSSGGGGCATVLMAATLDRHSDVVRFGVLESSNDVSIASRLHDHCRVHVMINAMRARRILIVVVLVGLAIDGVLRGADVLYPLEVLNGRHVDQLCYKWDSRV
jgi:hypothetical protein